MKRLLCQKCRSYTNQKILYAKLIGPQRWEEIYSICRSCADLGRDPLCRIFRDVYSINDSSQFDQFIHSKDADELRKLIGSVLARILSRPSIPTFDRIAFNLRREASGIGAYQLKELLTTMESNGLVLRTRIDYTEQVLRTFLSPGKAGKNCPACGKPSSFISLYSEFTDDISSAKRQNIHRKVGGYCLNCRQTQIDIGLALSSSQIT